MTTTQVEPAVVEFVIDAELAVVEAAIEAFGVDGEGFVHHSYFVGCETESSGVTLLPGPGPGVLSTCAIGGVEQAIWKLTGTVMTRVDRDELAHIRDEDQIPEAWDLDETHKLYGRVMGRLNRISREIYEERGVEEVSAGTTLNGRPVESLVATLAVFNRAAEELRA